MNYYQLSNGKTLIIREAKKEDAPRNVDCLNIVCKETENLTFGENEFINGWGKGGFQ